MWKDKMNQKFKKNTIKTLLTFLILHSAFCITPSVYAALDESKPYNIDDVVEIYNENNKNNPQKNVLDYAEDSDNYYVGQPFTFTADKVRTVTPITLSSKYRYNRNTGTFGTDSVIQTTEDVVFKQGGSLNTNNYDNTAYIGTKVRGNVGDYVATGMHIYSYTPAEGTLIPIERWKNYGYWYAAHYENINGYEDLEGNANIVDGKYYQRVGNTKWYAFMGLEFHSIRTDLTNVTTFPGEQNSPCVEMNSITPGKVPRTNYLAWMPICAVCGDIAAYGYQYAPAEAVRDIPVWAQGQAFLYNCHYCDGMEQGVTGKDLHRCKGLSTNRLVVNYNANGATGYLKSDVFLYDGGTTYEGKTIEVSNYIGTPIHYTKEGYTFAGWATSPTATEAKYRAGQIISDLKSEFATPTNHAQITLYAVWKPNVGTLTIQHENTYTGGAKYNGQENFIINLTYPATFTLSEANITTPNGYVTNFNANGGSVTESSITATTSFVGSRLSINNSNGYYDNDNLKYTLGKTKGNDTIILSYKQNEIKLPEASKNGALLVGWFTKASGGEYIGLPGDTYLPTSNNQMLYAVYDDLEIEAKPTYYTSNTTNPTCSTAVIRNLLLNNNGTANSNYTPNSNYAIRNATGATTLHLQMVNNPTLPISYKPYWRLKGDTNWNLITTTEGISQIIPSPVSKSVSTVGNGSYTVPETGIYQLTAIGAQGSGYDTKTGGKGGQVSGYFLLKKGDVLTYTVGSQDGTYGGGGKATKFGNGGGATTIKLNNTTILVAGGGGGATDVNNGGNGGETTNLVSSGSNGQDGMAGGGGGYLGGLAGESLFHEHDDTCGYHMHDGTASSGGLCYEQNSYPNVVCGVYEKAVNGVTCYTCGEWHKQHVANGESCSCVVTGGDSNAVWVGHGAHNPNGVYSDHNYSTSYKSVCNNCGHELSGTTAVGTNHMVQGYNLICAYQFNGWQCGLKGLAKTPQVSNASSTVYKEATMTSNPWDFYPEISEVTNTSISGNSSFKHENTSYSTVTTGNIRTPGTGEVTIPIRLYANQLDSVPALKYTFVDRVEVKIYNADSGALLQNIDVYNSTFTQTSQTKTPACGQSNCTLDYHQCIITKYNITGTNINGTRTMRNHISQSNHSGGWFSQYGEDEFNFTVTQPINSTINNIYVTLTYERGNITPNFIYYKIQNIKYTDKGEETNEAASSKPGYGGSNYVASSAYSGSNISTTTTGTGNGSLSIVSKDLNNLIGVINHQDIFGAYTPDTANPDRIKNLEVSEDSGIMAWEEPSSNATVYEFKVDLYQWDSSTLGMKQVKSSQLVESNVESAIAGYYIIYDNSSNTSVADYIINTKAYKPSYTWSNQYLTSGDSTHKVQFVTRNDNKKYSIDLKNNANGYNYAHIAAVDIAGNIGLTALIDLGSLFSDDDEDSGIEPKTICNVIFNTNCLSYQLTPETTVSYGTWNPNCEKRTLSVGPLNKQGYFYQGYYQVSSFGNTGSNGIYAKNGATNIKYGGAFPTVTATGCTFVGWNTKPDGTGSFVTTSSKPLDIIKTQPGYTDGDYYEKTITLYAIWNENDGSSSISATYIQPTGQVKTVGSVPYMPVTEKTITSGSTSWTNNASVKTTAQIAATGVDRMAQYYKHTSDSTWPYSYKVGFSGTDLVEETVKKFENYTNLNCGDYDSNTKSLNLKYDLQGTINVYGQAGSVEKTYGSRGGNIANTPSITLKLDKTKPELVSCTFTKEELKDIPLSNLETKLQEGIKTKISVVASDYLKAENGAFPNNRSNDSSGISAVYITFTDIDNPNITKTFPLSLKTIHNYTYQDNHVLKGTFEEEIDLYAEFPNSSHLSYYIQAIDLAGNISDISYGDKFIMNFDVRTVIYNDENNIFNVDVENGGTYFKLNDSGHVEVYTIGYVDKLQFDFKKMGLESVNEIKNGQIDSDYNMGVLESVDSTYARYISYTVATPIVQNSYKIFDKTTNSFITVSSNNNPSLYNSIAKVNGKPYAACYKVKGWGSNGTSIRIPPYYPRTKDGNKVHEDGSPQYKWERHTYDIYGYKNEITQKCSSEYVLWDALTFDVHYRVIHQGKNNKIH